MSDHEDDADGALLSDDDDDDERCLAPDRPPAAAIVAHDARMVHGWPWRLAAGAWWSASALQVRPLTTHSKNHAPPAPTTHNNKNNKQILYLFFLKLSTGVRTNTVTVTTSLNRGD